MMAFYMGDLRRALPDGSVPSCSAAASALIQAAADTGEVARASPKQGAVPVSGVPALLVLMPLQQHQDASSLQSALLAANSAVSTPRARLSFSSLPIPTSASSSWSAQPFVPLARTSWPPSETDLDSEYSGSETLSDVLQDMPSFGQRTAAAKKLLSAAPGGPVYGNRWATSHQVKKLRKGFCPFCKKNGERKETYTTHGLNERRPDGSVRVMCPVLRSLRCEICGATGDQAHTRTHCPLGISELPVATILKTTQRRCDGSRRSFVK